MSKDFEFNIWKFKFNFSIFTGLLFGPMLMDKVFMFFLGPFVLGIEKNES